MLRLHGIIPPVATAMLPDEELDVPRFEWFVEHLIGAGVHGLFVLGTNGEFYALDEREKQTVIAAAVEQARGRLPVIAGVGAETTREVLRLTRLAERAGADAVAVITPYFIHPRQEEIIDHYRRVADAAERPVVLYNNPAACGGVAIAPDSLGRLAEHGNIVGIKDSSGDLDNTLEYLRGVSSGFAVLQGRDTLIYSSLALGVAGAVPASATVAPELCVAIYEMYLRGDNEASRAAQLRLNPVRACLQRATPPAGVKAALEMLGRPIGPCRAPVASLPTAERQQIRQALAKAGLWP
jgi:4-hydroxy-tetrahydrodipicolinate synthase